MTYAEAHFSETVYLKTAENRNMEEKVDDE